MHVEAQAVARAVRHAAPCVGPVRRRHAAREPMRVDDRKGRAVDVLARGARTHGGDAGTLGLVDGGVHGAHRRVRLAVHHRARAVAVVERALAAREDVDDHRLPRAQLAVAVLVAVCSLRAAGDDRRRAGEPQAQEVHVDHEAQALGRQPVAVVEEDAVAVRDRARDGLAGHAHRILRGPLRGAQPLHLLRVLRPACHHAEQRVVLDGDARQAQVLGIDEGERAVGHHVGHALAADALGDRLRGGGLAVAGEAPGRLEVARARDRVGTGLPAGALHLDVAADEHPVRGTPVVQEVDARGRVADVEAHRVVEAAVGGRDARDQSSRGHGAEDRTRPARTARGSFPALSASARGTGAGAARRRRGSPGGDGGRPRRRSSCR